MGNPFRAIGRQRPACGYREAQLLDYNERDAHRRNVCLIPVGWEITLGGMGRPQSRINDDVRSCDYLILILWDRWGTPTTNQGSSAYTSGSHEEYCVAQECYHNPSAAMRDVVVFFKGVDSRQLSDPGPELQQVLNFRQELQNKKELLYHTFDTLSEFVRLLEMQLAGFVHCAEHGDSAKCAQRPMHIATPTHGYSNHSVTSIAPPKDSTGTSESPDVLASLLAEAEQHANEGDLVGAETRLSRAVVQFPRADSFNGYGSFLVRVGRLDQALQMYENALVHAPDDTWRAIAYGNLGWTNRIRGDLGLAEKMHREALAINERLGRLRGVANDYGNLGLISWTRGNLQHAEEMMLKALSINETNGWLDGMAKESGNLGTIYQTRGDLERAEIMYRRALTMYEKLQRLDGIANQYGNLSGIFKSRGELDEAERLLRMSLAIEEKLGRQEGLANDYANLGLICWGRGELGEAEKLLHKALSINEMLGRLEGMASNYGNLGGLYHGGGDLERAEMLYRKALSINEQLGKSEGMAVQYSNLGLVWQARGDFAKARALWTEAHGIYERIGMPHMATKIRLSLEALPRQSGSTPA